MLPSGRSGVMTDSSCFGLVLVFFRNLVNQKDA